MSAVMESESEAEVPKSLAVELPVTTELTTKIKPAGALALAQVWEIDSAEMAQAASDQRAEWAQQIDEIKKARADFLDPAKRILEAAARWFNPPIEDRESGRKVLGDKLLTWNEKEKARIAAERAQREEEARKARQKAEQEAAAARARAEEQAREERRRADEAEERRRQAEAEGNARAAAAAAAEAAKAKERAEAVVENANARAEQAHVEAAAMALAPKVVETKIHGSTVRENWVAVLRQGMSEDQAKALIVKAAATNPQLLGLIDIDVSALNKLAKALKGAMDVPGYEAKDVPVLAGSRKKK